MPKLEVAVTDAAKAIIFASTDNDALDVARDMGFSEAQVEKYEALILKAAATALEDHWYELMENAIEGAMPESPEDADEDED